jgi:transcriptional regulator GlxA family with amidase domain
MEDPPEPLLKLKVKELITSILLSESNGQLAAYLIQQASAVAPDIEEIMEANFRYNLSIEEFARMCNRSLSTFKRDFQKALGEPPGRWLRTRRLKHGAGLLIHSDLPITEIAYECGFEDVSHFCKVFKEVYHTTAGEYREAGTT